MVVPLNRGASSVWAGTFGQGLRPSLFSSATPVKAPAETVWLFMPLKLVFRLNIFLWKVFLEIKACLVDRRQQTSNAEVCRLSSSSQRHLAMLSVALGILKTFPNICIREPIQKGITVRPVMLLLQYEALEGGLRQGSG